MTKVIAPECRPRRRPSTVTIKFRDGVGRVTPCAPRFTGRPRNGAHGVTRPTFAAGGVTKLVCRSTRAVNTLSPGEGERVEKRSRIIGRAISCLHGVGV